MTYNISKEAPQHQKHVRITLNEMRLLVTNLCARMYHLGKENWWPRGTQEYNSPGSEGVKIQKVDLNQKV